MDILKRIQQLGGAIEKVCVHTPILQQLILISFDVALYQKPLLTSWADINDQESLIGLNEFMTNHQHRLADDCCGVYQDIVEYYYP